MVTDSDKTADGGMHGRIYSIVVVMIAIVTAVVLGVVLLVLYDVWEYVTLMASTPSGGTLRGC